MTDAPLTSGDRRTLLRIAHRAIEHRASTGRQPTRAELHGLSLAARLEEPQGAFVTLEQSGQLRGCIGHMAPVMPLWEAVAENAVRAGWSDPRFESLHADEASAVDVEITVIGPLEAVRTSEEITVGTHGLMIEGRGRRGVLLPQVATEHGWDAETFLDATCRKAGLAAGAWRQSGTLIWRYTAEHFSDSDLTQRSEPNE